MPETPLRLIKRIAEFQDKEDSNQVPPKRRGLYVLYCKKMKGGKSHFDVVYVGMARTGIRGRLQRHRTSKRKLWTHFSAFEVWDNIRDEEIAELEGLFRYIYRKDSTANKFNIQRGFAKARKVREDNLKKWKTNQGKRSATEIEA